MGEFFTYLTDASKLCVNYAIPVITVDKSPILFINKILVFFFQRFVRSGNKSLIYYRSDLLGVKFY